MLILSGRPTKPSAWHARLPRTATAPYVTTAHPQIDLAARCHRAAIEGRWATTMRFFAGPTLLAIRHPRMRSDICRYPPRAPPPFQVIAKRYTRTSTIVTTNRPITLLGSDPGRHHRRRRPAGPPPTPPGRPGHRRGLLPPAGATGIANKDGSEPASLSGLLDSLNRTGRQRYCTDSCRKTD